MKNVVQKTSRRTAPIDLSADQFRMIGHDLVDKMAEFLDGIDKRPVTTNLTPEQVRAKLRSGSTLPKEGTDPARLMQKTIDLLLENSLFNGHPRFWGYITSSPAPIGILADLLASSINQNLGGWQLSPMATEIEAQSIRWIAEFMGYPSDCGGVLTSGGNMANFACFMAARKAAAKYDIQSEGLGNSRLRIYASKETHTWIEKATDLFGFGTANTRRIKTDSNQRLDMNDLRKTLEDDLKNGDTPMMVVGTAGTVSTGAVDPLPEIADLCREYNIWFHVDGAYGGFAAALDNVDENIYGLRDADSIAVDPHKWLYAPLEAGCALVRDSEKIRSAFSYHPPYYHFGEEAINYVDYGMQNSRGFRALKVWLAFQHVGRDGYVRMIEEDIRLAQEIYRLVDNESEIEALTHNLSITTFRFIPADLRDRADEEKVAQYLDELNEEILVRLKRSGEVFISNAVLNDRFVLRSCIVNFRTSQDDVEALPGVVVRYGREADDDLRFEMLA
ncbi:MAG: aminotransferase class V-fold PLP-dependent enzyme [candidate division Zixibacteria bacterium]|nr:aminotransferase class V-fold PLP-dependent enzyme [candidate division Zixibacteria bacterium]NIW40026.1 aminotransferase class V-fold PLP-dependent enzyme [candidate division Zixibacteria bacterium]NIX58193.1 aminotransferase class V-fold PLP-dependent enzyme [candidate division Zixibacteria bacterium]